NKEKMNLEKRVETLGLDDKIFRVIVPEEEETEHKDGKKKTSMKKFFPGYVLSEMYMTDDSWYVVRNTQGVTGLVVSCGQATIPISLFPHEVDTLLKKIGMEDAKVKVDYEIKENVKVIDGPFASFMGTIEYIDADKENLKVHVNMFGRETPVELDFNQVEKV